MTVLHLPTSHTVAGVSGPVVADRAGISLRMLHYWVLTGRVTCVDSRHGKGNASRWTPAETAHVIRTADLVRAGFRVDVAADVARRLGEHETVRIAHGLTVTEATA